MIGLNRRRYNIIIPDYITDGLVFHLDGKNKGETEDAWTDVIGNKVYTNMGQAVFEDDCVRFTGGSTSYLNGSQISTSWTPTAYTIEACIETTQTSQGCIFKGGGGNARLGLWINSGVGARVATSASANVPRYLNNGSGARSISYTNILGVQDFTEMELAASGSYMSAGHSSSNIGSRRTSSGADWHFKGRIYDIRIYSRKLTLEEMLHNQKVDKLKYL